MKILLIRFSSIGDIVLTTPLIRCLKLQTNCEIHYLTKKSFQGVLAHNPYLHQIHTIEKRVKEVLPTLQKEQFDYVVDLHHNLRSQQVKMLLRSQSLTFDKINVQKWLMVNFKINRLPKVHIVERYLATVAQLGVKNDGLGLDFFIPSKDEVAPTNLLFEAGFKADTPYIAFVIGAAHATKRMTSEKIIELCRAIPLPVLLIGGPTDVEAGKMIAANAGAHVVNTCGNFNLNQSASLVRQARWVISHDTGMMHIAAAFQKEIVSIWGNTIPDFGMYPYYAQNVQRNITVEMKGLGCRPCSKIGFEKCPKGHFACMNQIPNEAVLKVISS
ncbi:MAG: glycosyltransferase family 9 protein [Saprospiraceae bacterium]|nr:glycosyltransferase family 9 protein [Saprospiraceae bacterium]